MAIAFNTEEVFTPPVASATVIVLRSGPADALEVLLVRRHGNSGVLGGAYVFPGGKLDAADRLADPAALDRPASACVESLGEPGLDAGTALGLHVAALRETFEESGLLLGQTDRPGLVQQVRAATAGGGGFAPALQALGLQVNTACVVPWSRWITPRVPAVTNRRFDTRFFVALAPEGQVVEHCVREATEAVWLTPRTALERCWAGEIDLAPPQIMSLGELSRLGSAAQVMAAARRRSPYLVEPEPYFESDGVRVLCYPGDPRHSVRERVWTGPTRLLQRNQRFEAEGGLAALLGP